jgi:hypothetical protein
MLHWLFGVEAIAINNGWGATGPGAKLVGWLAAKGCAQILGKILRYGFLLLRLAGATVN